MNKKQKDLIKRHLKMKNILTDFSELNPIAILGRIGGRGTNSRDKRIDLNESEESSVHAALTKFRDVLSENLAENEPGKETNN